jgi:GNAT superfamily N-acetyltransferase
MGAQIHETLRGNYRISTDLSLLQIEQIVRFLDQAYWAQGRSRETILRSLENSLCFGLYAGEQQVGLARVVTDYATHAWLCDVFIDEGHRSRGLGKWLIATVLSHPQLQTIRRWFLATRDAHGLYQQFGFRPVAKPDWLMEMLDQKPQS